jgi:hypothetical protein
VPITIYLPDGTTYNERTETMSTNQAGLQPMQQQGPQLPEAPRTIATVAAELEAATVAASKVKQLTEELRGMLYRKRAPRVKATP